MHHPGGFAAFNVPVRCILYQRSLTCWKCAVTLRWYALLPSRKPLTTLPTTSAQVKSTNLLLGQQPVWRGVLFINYYRHDLFLQLLYSSLLLRMGLQGICKEPRQAPEHPLGREQHQRSKSAAGVWRVQGRLLPFSWYVAVSSLVVANVLGSMAETSNPLNRNRWTYSGLSWEGRR